MEPDPLLKMVFDNTVFVHDYSSHGNTSTLRFYIKDLVTVFDGILTSRQTREKLQCLYENLMSNNFRKTSLLKKKNMNCKLNYKLHSKGFYWQIFGAVTLLKFLQTLALDFPYICLQFFPANSSWQEDKFFRDKCIAEILKGTLALVAACIKCPSIFFI